MSVWRFLAPSPHDEEVGRGLGRGANPITAGLFEKPLTPTLSQFVPHGEREKMDGAQQCRETPIARAW